MLRVTSFTLRIVLVLCISCGIASAEAKIDVFPAFAPNGTLSPSWDKYVVNALIGIEADGADVGDRSLAPDAYETVKGPIQAFDAVYTDYNSWGSWAEPSSSFNDFAAVFQSEFGERVHFGARVVGDGSWQFSLSQLEWSLDSDDDDDYFDQAGSFASANYSPTRVGIDYVDGIKGNGNDLILDNGEAGSSLVDELLYVGVGEGFNFGGNFFVTDQDEIDDQLGAILDNCAECEVNLTGTYTLNHPSHPDPIIGAATVVFDTDFGFGGDIDRNGVIDCDDLDILTAAVAAGPSIDVFLDVNGDNAVNFDDVHHFVDVIEHTYFGDANCDGEFSSKDLIKIFQAGKYETGDPAVWSEGDWNADGVFNTTDLVLAFVDGGYELGPRWVPAASVPEPTSIVLVIIGVFALIATHRRK